MEGITILYQDRRMFLVLKPAGVLSTDEPGGVPERLRTLLGDPQSCVRTIHRLDQVTGGLMVYARSVKAASELSRQIMDRSFEKRYLAVVQGTPEEPVGTMKDLLYRSNRDRKTYVVPEMGKRVQPASLTYRVLETVDDLSLCEIVLQTGRTHQIRAQFSSRGLPLWGDRKYGGSEDSTLALWSWYLRFRHPQTGESVAWAASPPRSTPWDRFSTLQDYTCGEEILDVVDDQGLPTGDRVARTVAHALGIQHRTSHVWLLRRKNGKVQILLQKRAEDKDSFPGCWDISSAGHIPAGVDFRASALRELREELGVTPAPEELLDCGLKRISKDATFFGAPFHDRQVSRVYGLWLDKEARDFILQDTELSAVKWFDFDACVNLVRFRSEPNCIDLEELHMLEQLWR